MHHHRDGFQRLQEAVKDHFGFDFGVPSENEGLSNWALSDVINSGVDVQEADEETTEEFIRRFVPDHLLKAQWDCKWSEFLRRQYPQAYQAGKNASDELTAKVVQTIKEQKARVGFQVEATCTRNFHYQTN